MSAARVALGFDPGTAQCGFGVIAREGQRVRFVDAGTVKTASAFTLTDRLQYIWRELTDVVREHRPLVMGIEDQLGMAARSRSNINRQLMAARKGEAVKGFGYNADNDGVMGAQFVAMSVAFAYRVRVILLQPKTIKVNVMGPGGGEADKAAIKAAVTRLFPELRDARFSSHAADGIAAAVTAERMDHVENRRAG